MSQWCPKGGPAISDVASRSPSRKAYLKASRSVSRNQGGFLENSPADFPEGFPEKWPEGFLENFPECLPEGFPGACLEGLSAGLPECFQKLLSAGLPESGGCRFPANFLEGQCHRETFARFHLSLGMSGWKDLVYLSERLRRATSKVMISLREARGLRNHRNNSSDLTAGKYSVICYVLTTHYRAMSRIRG